ncbi:MAG: HD domain-containing protein [Deltaproteobacteria bacterium]|nr:HD domain-containing protein [Deltaproteobacteria bacterium]
MERELLIGLDEFKKGLSENKSASYLQRRWTSAVDHFVAGLFNSSMHAGSKMSVLALGGYGRSEMSPYSDVDLMFLYEGDIDPARKVVDAVLYPLWNLKFEAGGATRTLNECRSMFNEDIRAQTAMIDARFVAGDRGLAESFFSLVNRQMSDPKWKKKFIRLKCGEQSERIIKFGGSVYMLEPHIKNSEGGLRELQTLRWISNKETACYIKLEEDSETLFLIRDHLHFIAGKREDRLTFENQKVVAERLNCTPDELMGRYYRSAASIHLKLAQETGRFLPLIQRLYGKLKRARVKRLIGNEPSWLRLVANRDILDDALKILHETGELKKIVPSFRNIFFKSQFGAYHVYTVDVHSILTVKKIVQLEKGCGPKGVAAAYRECRKKDILLLAALLHDIGKGEAGEHIRTGAEMAKKEALNLGLPEKDSEMVAFLVESHLVMPKIAFSRDLADFHIIENFANSLPDKALLNMLYVLSYADIASIGPDVWNDWKERLLGELFQAARKYLSGCKPEKNVIKPSKLHTGMYAELKDKPVLVRHIPCRSYSELHIMSRDAPGIFSKIAGAVAASNASILEARLSTAKNGIVLDILRVRSDSTGHLTEQTFRQITADMEAVFKGEKTTDELICRESVLKKKGAGVSPTVAIDNDASVYYTVVDISATDRIGLLYDLSHVFFNEGCSIDVAKALTKGDMAVDSFYIKDFRGQKISSMQKLEKMKKALAGVI